MLTIEGLNQYYGESHTLWDLGLEAPEGVVTCLMGRNGVGKTTLLKCIMGLLPIRSGQMTFAGEDLSRLPAERRAPLGIGYVPQGRQIFPLLTVEENLKIGLAANPRRPRQIPEFIFELFPVLKTMLKRRGGDLSGGQQQQLAFGRALALEPRLLILDEPTEGIQPNVVREIGRVIRRLNEAQLEQFREQASIVKEIGLAVQRVSQERGMTVLLVEQKLPFARWVAQQFCIVDKGRAVATGAIADLKDDLVRQYLTV
ncbi:MAG: ABC transporter ATP-binding protein [Candidatus Contendobacter sp.]|jgi:urea transport system ATP-binding protein|nr:ABC transporter ATP-binding protein [Gammaproteobacteria bacterium]MCC8994917.1 ABC transporter ATP-binding protein [Candidatus Contendobacter sp.]